MAAVHEASAPADAILKVAGVSKYFGGVRAVADVSIDVPRGSIFSVIGPNGAGKTSLVNMISGFYTPDTGDITFNGTRINDLRPNERAELGIARTFQNIALFRGLNVLENLMLGRHVRMKSGVLSSFLYWGPAQKEEIANRIRCEEIIDFLKLNDLRKQSTGALAYGFQKRVELGRALALEPDLLLLDEPMAGMGADESARMIELLRGLKGRHTIVLIEHDMDAVFALADRITVLVYGRAIATGTPAEIRANTEVRQAYLGDDHGG